MQTLRRLLLLVGLVLAGTSLPAAERIPPAPPRYFNDYAGVVSRPAADRLNAQLEQFERDSSNQILVVLYPKMESDSSAEDYTVRVAQAWRVGQKARNNGAVLFAFMQEHRLYLQVGYGLESVLPDATAKRIIEREIVPRFRAGDVDGGMTAAVASMIAAARGEYQGTGRTVADSGGSSELRGGGTFVAVVLFIIFIAVAGALRRRGGSPLVIGSRRPGIYFGNSSWLSGGGSSSSWSSGDSGGGGFSGGGGSFGGGGAGGSW